MKIKKILNVVSVTTLLYTLTTEVTGSPVLSDPPNIILVVADDMGYSDLGCYGGEIQTPVLDSLAYNGLRFTQFYNAGICWATRSSILTGYYSHQVNTDPHRRWTDGKQVPFPEWGYLLPHHLKQAGYRSYHSGKWHILNINKPVAQGGFDHSYLSHAYNRYFSPQNHYLDDEQLPPVERNSGYYTTTAIANYSISFLKEHQQQFSEHPFFLYVAFHTPHFPLQAPQKDIDKYRGRYTGGWEELKQKRYNKQKELGFDFGENSAFEYHVTWEGSWSEKLLKDTIGPGEIRKARPWDYLTPAEKDLQATKMAIHAAMVDRIDQEIGRILEQVKAMGEDKNTLVLFISDNGACPTLIVRGDGHKKDAFPGSADSFLCLGPGWSTASNTPFRRHKAWTHEGGITTPLIIYWPNGIEAKGEFRNSVGHVIDFLPTFLDIAGINALTERNGFKAPPFPGKSLVPLFAKDQQSSRELYFNITHDRDFKVALRQGKWKAVFGPPEDGKWQLYNMEEDRTEIHDLSDDYFVPSGFESTLLDQRKRENQERLKRMKDRWHDLNKLFMKQGKVGF
jgi:arylsulfatase A-like enzyme